MSSNKSAEDPDQPGRRRHVANMRERRRMMLINCGFEHLKQRLPLRDFLRQDKSHLRLTKVDILRMTIQYIKHLLALLGAENGRAIEGLSGDAIRSFDKRAGIESTAAPSGKRRRRRRCAIKSAAKIAARQRHGEARAERPSGQQSALRRELDATQSSGGMLCKMFNATDSSCYILSWSKIYESERSAQARGQVPGSGEANPSRLAGTKLWIPDRGV